MTSVPTPTWKNFFRYVLPSLGAMVLFSSYTVIDGIFVAKGVSDLALAAVNLSLPFINILSGLSVLLTMGTSTLCAFALGSGDHRRAEEIFTQTVTIILSVSVVITVLVCLFARPLAYLLGARDLTMDYASQYLHIVCLFSLCFLLSYCLEVMVKVDGRPILAVVGVAISAVVHVGLDWIFIFRFGWEVRGSALATGLAQLGSLVFFLGYFLSGHSNLRFRRFPLHLEYLKKILPLGVADCSIEFMLGFLTLVYNHVILTTIGEAALPIYAVIAYLSLIVSMVMQGIAQGMMPLVSLAVGHGDRRAVNVFFRQCLLTVAAAAVLVELVCQLAPGPVVSLLLERGNPLFSQTVSALRQYAPSYLFAGFSIALAGYFAARGWGGASVLQSIGRGFVLLPGALLAVLALTGSTGIWWSALLGEALSLMLAVFLLNRGRAKAI